MNTENQGVKPSDAVADLLGGLVDRQTLNEIKAAEESAPAEKTKNNIPEKPSKQEAVDDTEEGNVDDGQEDVVNDDADGNEPEGAEEEPADDKKNVEIPDDKFGFKIKEKEKPAKQVKVEKFEDLPNVLKSKYGHNVKDVKDLPKFFESVDKWRKDSQELSNVSKEVEKVKKEKDNAIAVFENLPSDLLDAVKAHYNGEDYKKTILSNTLDFSKEKHDTKTLVNHYFPGEFTDDDFELDSREVKIAEKAAIDKYNAERAAREQRAKEHVQKAEERSKALKQSVLSSVEALKKDFPDMTPDVIKDIEETMVGGSLLGEFLNPDGTYKPAAAKMLALAKHGEGFINQLIEIAQRVGESRATEEFVDRANKKPRAKNSKGQEQPRKEVTELINDLLPDTVIGKRTF